MYTLYCMHTLHNAVFVRFPYVCIHVRLYVRTIDCQNWERNVYVRVGRFSLFQSYHLPTRQKTQKSTKFRGMSKITIWQVVIVSQVLRLHCVASDISRLGDIRDKHQTSKSIHPSISYRPRIVFTKPKNLIKATLLEI